jgi:hypothetical protein
MVIKIPGRSQSSGYFCFRKYLKELVVEPLPEWRVFSGHFNYLLSDDSTPE